MQKIKQILKKYLTFSLILKLLILIGAGLSIAMALRVVEQSPMAHFEYPVLLLFATLALGAAALTVAVLPVVMAANRDRQRA